MAAIPTAPGEADLLRKRVEALEGVLTRLPALLDCAGHPALPPGHAWAEGKREADALGYVHLVIRRHPWRRQLYLKGRNLTARQLVGAMRSESWDEERTAVEHGLPVEAVREAAAYADRFAAFIAFETALERLPAREGAGDGAEPLPR